MKEKSCWRRPKLHRHGKSKQFLNTKFVLPDPLDLLALLHHNRLMRLCYYVLNPENIISHVVNLDNIAYAGAKRCASIFDTNPCVISNQTVPPTGYCEAEVNVHTVACIFVIC